jgi:YgiT-type zinc finger domain-containing protein
MTGAPEGRSCPVCGGSLNTGEATIPYILKGDVVIVVKRVPAEICADCRESFTSGAVTDQITTMLRQLRDLHSEVSVVSFAEYQAA